MPEELAETAEMIARGRGISVNSLVIEALEAEIERVRNDTEFKQLLRELTERDKEIPRPVGGVRYLTLAVARDPSR